jgi:hypothetical protein
MARPRPQLPPKLCAVCGEPWTPRQRNARCCGLVCSTVLSAVKGLKRALGPWEPHQRDEWTRVGLRAFRAAWKA